MKIAFGKFELDSSARELRRDGQRVDLEPRAFELLRYLVEHRERAVSKDELLETVWPSMMVSETALTRCVMKARRAIDDDSSQQSLIRTIHGHGYRFIADTGPATKPTAKRQRTVRSIKQRLLLTGIAVAVAVVGISALLTLRADAVVSGTVAVAPVKNSTNDASLDWVDYGLMSLIRAGLTEAGVRTAGEHKVLEAASEHALGQANSERLRVFFEETDIDALLTTELSENGGLYRMTAVLSRPNGSKTRRVIVGQSPADVATAIATVFAELAETDSVDRDPRFRRVSDDAFVNELYARALDLELRGDLESAKTLFQLAAIEDPSSFWLRYEIALCARDLRQYEEAETLLKTLTAEARSLNNADALIAALNSHGIMQMQRHDFPTANALLSEALSVSEERDIRENLDKIHTNLALIDRRLGNMEKSRHHFEQAMDVYEDAGTEPAPSFLNNYAGLLLQIGDYKTARQFSERAIEGFRILGHRRYEAPSINRLATILRRSGQFDAAIQKHRQASSIYTELGNTSAAVHALSRITAVYRDTGDLTRARLNANAVLEQAATSDDLLILADAHIQSAYVEAEAGRHTSAIDEFSVARPMFVSANEVPGIRACDVGLADMFMKLGDVDQAAAIANRIFEEDTARGSPSQLAKSRILRSRVAMQDGDFAAANRDLQLAYTHAVETDNKRVLASAATNLVKLALLENDLPRAQLLLEEARALVGHDQSFQRLDAKVAKASGDLARALTIMTTLRSVSGERWTDDDQSMLTELRATP